MFNKRSCLKQNEGVEKNRKRLDSVQLRKYNELTTNIKYATKMKCMK